MKPIVILFSFIALANVADADLRYDFGDGMPREITLFDRDGNIPSADLAYTGLSKDVPWSVIEETPGGNRVACSTSWYVPSGRADDWMVLPPVEVGAGTVIEWRSRASDMNFRDGLSVYISTKGGTPEDFDTSEPLFSVTAEDYEWTRHLLSLGAYAGSKVWVAFVNRSSDCSMLYVDDIYVGSPTVADISLSGSPLVAPDKPFHLQCGVFTSLEHDVKGFRAEYDIAGVASGFIECPDKILSPGSSVDVIFPEEIALPKDEVRECTIWAEHEGERVEHTFSLSAFSRKMVSEEMTGTWCMYCVSGIVAMERLNALYPDDFIGIALHSGDPMAAPGFSYVVDGYPTCRVNRKEKMDPEDMERKADYYLSLPVVAGVKAECGVEDDRIDIRTNVYFAEDHPESRFNIAYALIENDVHVPDDARYCQKNAYAGGSLGEMGGFEDKPEVIPPYDMWYQEVGRAIFEDMEGIENSIPDGIKAGHPVIHNYSIELPENILVKENTELVVLLLNNPTGEILNACRVDTGELFRQSGMSVGTRDDSFRVFSDPSGDIVVESESAIESVAVYDVMGKILAELSPKSNTAVMKADSNHDVKIVRVVTEAGSYVRKLMY